MTSALLVTHGELGRVLMQEVERVLGPQAGVVILNNNDMSLEQMIAEVRARTGESHLIMFVDFCGGSPYLACRNARQSLRNTALISGVNLPMLFSFFTKREKLAFGPLVEMVQADGSRGIQVLTDEC